LAEQSDRFLAFNLAINYFESWSSSSVAATTAFADELLKKIICGLHTCTINVHTEIIYFVLPTAQIVVFAVFWPPCT